MDAVYTARNASMVVFEVERSLFQASVPRTHNWFLSFELAGNLTLLSLLFGAGRREPWPLWLAQCASMQAGLHCAQMLLSAALSDSTFFLLHATFYFLLFHATAALLVLGCGIYVLVNHADKLAGTVALITGGVHAGHLCFTVNDHYFKRRSY
ncbi:uncharacterized protein LOC144173390 [Haemaphysalis longicornis]